MTTNEHLKFLDGLIKIHSLPSGLICPDCTINVPLSSEDVSKILPMIDYQDLFFPRVCTYYKSYDITFNQTLIPKILNLFNLNSQSQNTKWNSAINEYVNKVSTTYTKAKEGGYLPPFILNASQIEIPNLLEENFRTGIFIGDYTPTQISEQVTTLHGADACREIRLQYGISR